MIDLENHDNPCSIIPTPIASGQISLDNNDSLFTTPPLLIQSLPLNLCGNTSYITVFIRYTTLHAYSHR